MYDLLARPVTGQRAIGDGVRVAVLIAALREQSGQVALCPLDTLLTIMHLYAAEPNSIQRPYT